MSGMNAGGLLEYLQTLPPETEIEVMGYGTITGGIMTQAPGEGPTLTLIAHTGNVTGKLIVLQGGRGRIMQAPNPVPVDPVEDCLCGTDHTKAPGVILEPWNAPETSPALEPVGEDDPEPPRYA